MNCVPAKKKSGAETSLVFVECHWCPRSVTPTSCLQSDTQVSVTVPRLHVQIPLPDDPHSLARDLSAITTARHLRRALINLQGRGSSKVNTYVTTVTRRYNSSPLFVDIFKHLPYCTNLLPYCAPLWLEKCYICHIFVGICIFSAQVCLKFRTSFPQRSDG